jgi:hypothetical protein
MCDIIGFLLFSLVIFTLVDWSYHKYVKWTWKKEWEKLKIYILLSRFQNNHNLSTKKV